jgi:hypothetical protein
MDCQLYDQLPAHKVAYHYPTEEEVDYLVANLRDSDRLELTENPYRNPDEDLYHLAQRCVRDSEKVWVVRDSGFPFLLFGVSRISAEVGAPWMFGTDLMSKHAKRITQLSPLWLQHFNYPVLANLFDTRNDTHIRWAYRMGFQDVAEYPNNPAYRLLVRKI